MKTLDPFLYKRPSRVTKTLVISRDDDPEFGFRVSLRALDSFDFQRMIGLRDELIARFVEPNEPWPMEADEPVMLEEPLCRTVATLIAMQSPVDEDGNPVPASERYSDNWLIGLCHNCPQEWLKLCELATEVSNKANSGKAKAT